MLCDGGELERPLAKVSLRWKTGFDLPMQVRCYRGGRDLVMRSVVDEEDFVEIKLNGTVFLLNHRGGIAPDLRRAARLPNYCFMFIAFLPL